MATKLSQDQLVEALSVLTVMEMSDLKKALETKWDVKAAASAAPMMMAAAAAPAAAVEESTEFNVMLEDAPAAKKIGIIKVVREVTGLGLKEAKDMVEAAPKCIKERAGKADAEDIVKKLTEAGAKATAKGL